VKTKHSFPDDDNEMGWLITYADLMTLLLVFFVLLFSISSVEKDRFEVFVNALQVEFQGALSANSLVDLNVIAPVTTDIPQPLQIDVTQTSIKTSDAADGENTGDKASENLTTSPVAQTDLQDWEMMVRDLQEAVDSQQLSEHATVTMPKDGMVKIVVDGAVFFEVGSARLNSRINPFVNVLLDTMYEHQGYKMNIHGHTDDTPIDTEQFPSNWELSAVRATTVLRYLVRGGVQPERLSATGYGDSVPLAPNTNYVNRARNRRIEFVLEKQGDD